MRSGATRAEGAGLMRLVGGCPLRLRPAEQGSTLSAMARFACRLPPPSAACGRSHLPRLAAARRGRAHGRCEPRALAAALRCPRRPCSSAQSLLPRPPNASRRTRLAFLRPPPPQCGGGGAEESSTRRRGQPRVGYPAGKSVLEPPQFTVRHNPSNAGGTRFVGAAPVAACGLRPTAAATCSAFGRRR